MLCYRKPLEVLFFIHLLVVPMLCGCTPTFVAPTAAVESSATISENFFTSYDNYRLPLRVWKPSGEITGVIIALHGFNDYSLFIEDSARYFNTRHLAVYAYDQRGFGETQTRGRWSGTTALAKDLATCISLVKKSHPATPLYILGESMGGAVTILTMAAADPPEADGLILVAPAVWSRSSMPLYQVVILSLTARIIPWKKVTGESLKITPSDNIDMLRRVGSDPLVIKKTRIDVIYGLTNLMDKAYESAERVRSRLLLLYGEKDEIIPRDPVFSFYQRLPVRSRGHQRMILYENGYHMLLRDLQAERVRRDIVAWIENRTK